MMPAVQCRVRRPAPSTRPSARRWGAPGPSGPKPSSGCSPPPSWRSSRTLAYVLLSGSDPAATQPAAGKPAASSSTPSSTPTHHLRPGRRQRRSLRPGRPAARRRCQRAQSASGSSAVGPRALDAARRAPSWGLPRRGAADDEGPDRGPRREPWHAPDKVNSSFVVPDGRVGTSASDASQRLGGTDVGSPGHLPPPARRAGAGDVARGRRPDGRRSGRARRGRCRQGRLVQTRAAELLQDPRRGPPPSDAGQCAGTGPGLDYLSPG